MPERVHFKGFEHRHSVMTRVRAEAWEEQHVPVPSTLSILEQAMENHRRRRAPDNGDRYLDRFELAAAVADLRSGR